MSSNSQVWMSHADTILKLPNQAECLGSTEDIKNAAFKIIGEKTYAIQFHPEVYHSSDGKKILERLKKERSKSIANFKSDVENNKFPNNQHTISMNDGELDLLINELK